MKKILLLCLSMTMAGLVSAQTCAPVSSDLKAWWQGEGNGLDYAGGYNATIKSGVTNATGLVGQCFGFDGSVNAYVTAGTAGNLGTSDFTVEFWLQTTGTNIMAVMEKWQECDACVAGWAIRVGRNGAGNYPGVIGFEIFGPPGCSDYAGLGTTVNDGQWHHVALVRSGVNASMYVDAVMVTNVTMPSVINVNNTATTQMGRSICACCDGTQSFNGKLDEVAIYSRALSSNEVASIFSAGTNGLGLCCADVNIKTQPASPKKIQTSSNAVFTVTSLGTALSYQWYHGSNILVDGVTTWGSTVSGSTATALTISHPLSTNDLGTYTVVVSNACDSVVSDEAYLDFAPKITTQPQSGTASIGQTYTNFTVVATGSPLTYKWRSSGGVPLNDPAKYGTSTNAPTLTIFNVDGTDADTYSVVVSNHGGAVTNSPSVTLSTPPTFTTQPVNKTNNCGGSVTFSVAAAGTGTLTYQWQSNTNVTGGFTNITAGPNVSGQTTKNLTISNIDASWSTNGYQCVVTGTIGTATSSVGTLYVRATATAVYVSPSTNICDGSPVTLSEIPCTPDVTSYQWRRNGTGISGATASTYTTTTAGSYTVVITNNWGTDTSSPSAVLKVVTSPTITLAPQSQTVLLGNAAYFIANAMGTTPLVCSWIKDGTVIATGVGMTNYTINSVTNTDAGSYTLQVANGCTTASSTPAAVLTVVSTPQCATNFVDSSMLDWWKFESNLVDSVSNYDGTATGVIYAAGKVNTGVQFDGTTNCSLTFRTNSANFGTNNFTVEFWVQTTSTNVMALMEKWQECDACIPGWSIRIGRNSAINDPGAIGFEIHCGGNPNNPPGCTNYGANAITVNDGLWHHVALVRAGVVASMYVDGSLVASVTMSRLFNLNNSTEFQMGRSICECCDGTQPFNGILDEVTIYNRALSAGEINTIYNASYQGKCSP